MKKGAWKNSLLIIGIAGMLLGAGLGEIVMNAELFSLYAEYRELAIEPENFDMSTNPATNGSQYLQNITNRLFEILGILGGVIVAILWVKVAINYFADDPQRKAAAKEDAIRALIGTIIIAVAVFGAIWAIAGWIVGASQSVIVPWL